MCISLLNVEQPHRASTIQPLAMVPCVKAHIDRGSVAHQLQATKVQKDEAERKTVRDVWRLILSQIHDATVPSEGVRILSRQL